MILADDSRYGNRPGDTSKVGHTSALEVRCCSIVKLATSILHDYPTATFRHRWERWSDGHSLRLFCEERA